MKRSRMKRLLLMLLAYAVGGAIINVAVAWGCAMWVDSKRNASLPIDDAKKICDDTLGQREWIFAHSSSGTGPPTWRSLAAGVNQDETAIALHQISTGFPIKAMDGSLHIQGSIHETQWSWQIPAALGRRFYAYAPGVIPLRPLWPGFVINTIFYAAILWLLSAVPGFVRRRIRARRGQCPACAYPIGTSEVCTECGRPIASRMRPANSKSPQVQSPNTA